MRRPARCDRVICVILAMMAGLWQLPVSCAGPVDRVEGAWWQALNWDFKAAPNENLPKTS